MKWFLVIWVATGGGFGDMVVPSHSTSAEIAMPSQEVCQEVQKLNVSADCIAKLPRAASTIPMNGTLLTTPGSAVTPR